MKVCACFFALLMISFSMAAYADDNVLQFRNKVSHEIVEGILIKQDEKSYTVKSDQMATLILPKANFEPIHTVAPEQYNENDLILLYRTENFQRLKDFFEVQWESLNSLELTGFNTHLIELSNRVMDFIANPETKQDFSAPDLRAIQRIISLAIYTADHRKWPEFPRTAALAGFFSAKAASDIHNGEQWKSARELTLLITMRSEYLVSGQLTDHWIKAYEQLAEEQPIALESLPDAGETEVYTIVNGAATGNAYWCYRLAIMLENGFYFPRNPERAFQMYTIAATSDNFPAAMIKVGDAYREGLYGFPKDLYVSYHFYNKALEAGNDEALIKSAELSVLHMNAHRTYQTYQNTLAVLYLARDRGYGDAKFLINRLNTLREDYLERRGLLNLQAEELRSQRNQEAVELARIEEERRIAVMVENERRYIEAIERKNQFAAQLIESSASFVMDRIVDDFTGGGSASQGGKQWICLDCGAIVETDGVEPSRNRSVLRSNEVRVIREPQSPIRQPHSWSPN